MDIPGEKLFIIIGKLQAQNEVLAEAIKQLHRDLEEKNKTVAELQKQLNDLKKDTEH